MSFFATGYWIPSSIEFGARFLDTGLNFYDSLVSTLICTLFSGIQLCMCRRILQLHLRLRMNETRSRRQQVQSLLLAGISVLFAAMYIASALIYCVQFSRNILALRSVGATADVVSIMGLPSFRGCSRNAIGRCVDVPLSNLEAGRRMELGYATLVQVLILFTDVILVVRVYNIFFDRLYVFWIAAASLIASVGVSIFGLVALAQAGGLSGGSSWNWKLPKDIGIPTLVNVISPDPSVDAHLPRGYFPPMSIIASLIVNAIATACIVTRMLVARKELHDSLPLSDQGEGRKDDVYTSAAALLIESALPPTVFGILAAIFSTPGARNTGKVFDFELIPKVAWVAFTALAPQLILVRILQGRAWSSSRTFSLNGVINISRGGTGTPASEPITFSREDLRRSRRSSMSSDTASEMKVVVKTETYIA
ncbi:hypothetical protein DFP72DRAFT_904758 [Ephemerocybe angulata]|uniref:Uncharacterized protein n=1 Tax=Ephemerocybe angulata TaxID=980116 RepID=A0A8H6HTJ6_9AGAR|nr:hypothetical protein DFP72DRAFT_904758 [Tulosesus angulatus]